jgi:hypothetical protein
MKKIVSLVVALVLFTASAFAAPLSGTDSFNAIRVDTARVSGNQTETASEVFSAVDESDSLFVDVRAVALTDTEASEIEGAGPIGAFLGAIVGGAVGAIVGGVTGGANGAIAGTVGGAVGGGVMGGCGFPF